MTRRPRPATRARGRGIHRLKFSRWYSHGPTRKDNTMSMGRVGRTPQGAGSQTTRITRRECRANPQGEPAYGYRTGRGWGRRGLIDVFEASQAGFSKEVLRKEVIQPQVPLRLPCYDLVPITGFIFGACLSAPTTSDAPRFGGLTGGVYKAQEHIHRRSADRRLLAIPASCGRVAARNPNWGTIFAISAALRPGDALSVPL